MIPAHSNRKEEASLTRGRTHRSGSEPARFEFAKGVAIRLPEAYIGDMLTEGGKTPPGTQRLVV